MKQLTLNVVTLVLMLVVSACNYEPEFQDLEGFDFSQTLPDSDVNPDPDPDRDPDRDPDPCQNGCVQLETSEDSFTQSTSDTINEVDIVWVVDNSGSMQDDQQAIADNFSAFISEFLDRNIDFKMGVTTTDIRRHNGAFVHDPDLLTAQVAAIDRPGFIQDFQDTIRVGTNGYWIEEAFTNLVESTRNNQNAGFFRENALAAFINVTDEREQSNFTVESMMNDLITWKNGNDNLVKVYSIHQVFGNQNDQRFIEAATLSGGFTADIQGDFYRNLRDIGGSILELLNSFILSNIPYNPNDIRVYVDNSEVTVGWTYNSQTNAVVFDSNALPAEGAAIRVVYDYAVIP